MAVQENLEVHAQQWPSLSKAKTIDSSYLELDRVSVSPRLQSAMDVGRTIPMQASFHKFGNMACNSCESSLINLHIKEYPDSFLRSSSDTTDATNTA